MEDQSKVVPQEGTSLFIVGFAGSETAQAVTHFLTGASSAMLANMGVSYGAAASTDVSAKSPSDSGGSSTSSVTVGVIAGIVGGAVVGIIIISVIVVVIIKKSQGRVRYDAASPFGYPQGDHNSFANFDSSPYFGNDGIGLETHATPIPMKETFQDI